MTQPVNLDAAVERPPTFSLRVGLEFDLYGHRWVVKGIHLGALGQESLIHLEGLSHAPGWTGPWEFHPMLFVPEVMLSAAMALSASNARAEAAEEALRRAREALEPFAAYSQAMDAYAAFHRGQSLPDGKIMAYSQTEDGATCAALVIGHFRDADKAFGGRAKGWSGVYRSKTRTTLASMKGEG